MIDDVVELIIIKFKRLHDRKLEIFAGRNYKYTYVIRNS
jgi:hypothetical protein